MSENHSAALSGYEFLISGRKYLENHPDFKLIGRDEEMKKLSSILTRKKANSVVLAGVGGVGCSALAMGLQAGKKDPNATFDIVGKHFYWLDTDAMFASGNSTEINENFKKITDILSRSWKVSPGHEPDSVLIIDDMADFLDAVRNFGCTNLVNELMSDVKKNKFQIIAEARHDRLDTVLKAHSDMTEFFTLMPVEEPKGDALKAIVTHNAQKLAEYHGIKMAPDIVEQAIFLTNRYPARDASLKRGQPERAVTLIDRAYASYRQQVHAQAPELEKLEPQLVAVTAALAGKPPPELKGIGKEELETRKAVLDHEIADAKKAWDGQQEKVKKFYTEIRTGEDLIVSKEEELTRLMQAEAKKPKPKDKAADDVFGQETGEMREVRAKIAQYNAALAPSREKYAAHTKEINATLELTKDQLYAEFSKLSGIPVTKLSQNETEKLLNLENTLSQRVFDQNKAVSALSRAVRTSKAGVKLKQERPDAAFIFLGPSGVGKTELALAITQALYDDEKSMLRFDMSEFSQENDVKAMTGAPPGYEGYEAGGRLTNAVRNQPRSVVLFDEIEKGHEKTYDILLQVVDAGRLTDNHGIVSDFSQTVIIMTSNIGSEFFLDPNLTEEEAAEKALEKLRAKYRPEFLNRFAGQRNIICFNKLGNPTVVRIAERELAKVNDIVKNKGVQVSMDAQTIKDVVDTYYNPANGARGITGFFETDVTPIIAETILRTPNDKGVMKAMLDPETKQMVIAPPVPAPANENNIARPAAAPSPAAAFNKG